jgi:hypothetical protein
VGSPAYCGFVLERCFPQFCSVQERRLHKFRSTRCHQQLEAEYRASLLTDAKAVKSVIEKFREKYGAKDVKKYYSKFDVAVLVWCSQLSLEQNRAIDRKASAVQIS